MLIDCIDLMKQKLEEEKKIYIPVWTITFNDLQNNQPAVSDRMIKETNQKKIILFMHKDFYTELVNVNAQNDSENTSSDRIELIQIRNFENKLKVSVNGIDSSLNEIKTASTMLLNLNDKIKTQKIRIMPKEELCTGNKWTANRRTIYETDVDSIESCQYGYGMNPDMATSNMDYLIEWVSVCVCKQQLLEKEESI